MSGAAESAAIGRPLVDVPAPLRVSDGTLEALKWLGLVLMTLDHVNKYLLSGAVPALFALGRLTVPIFAFVLAYNLARPGALGRGVHARLVRRLLLVGVLASAPFVALGGLLAGWWPLNIMFALAVATGIIWLVDKGGAPRLAAAAVLFIAGGLMVEYWWPGLAVVVASWAYCRRPSAVRLVLWMLAIAALSFNGWAFAAMPPLNACLWALLAIPVVLLASRVGLRVPRVRWMFYLYYPLHLAVLLGLLGLLAK